MEADHRLFYTGKTEGIKCIGLIGEKHDKEVKVMAQDLTKGNPFSVILKFSLPVIGGNLFQLFYTLADTVIVGRTLGADALAAVGSTAIVIYLVLCFI